ncbi:hypothetical protein H7686_0002640 [Candidatus Phytoplasma asiaticum]|uniref:Effector n=3 Tax=Candidatus Phytoplasma asiaticum TaxID=2763338 RepID=A0AAX3B9J0_9MOLU|nr:hypothetical protein H7686_0002640 ['Parthenium hysterophorus' phyllody phytoplasma]
MLVKYLQNKIIKLLIAVFILFLSLNLFLIIFFKLDNNFKKFKLFSSNKPINNSEKLKINIMDVISSSFQMKNLQGDEKKLLSIDSKLPLKEIIFILQERLLNQFQVNNQIHKAYVLAQEDAHIKVDYNDYYILPQDEIISMQNLIYTRSYFTEEETIKVLSDKLLTEYRINQKRLKKYIDFLKNQLNPKMINDNSLNIKITLNNKQMPDILFYIMIIKTVLAETQYRTTILNEQLKADQKLQLLEHDFMNTKDWIQNENNKLSWISPNLSPKEKILILKEKLINQFRQRNKLAKYYELIYQKAFPTSLKQKRPTYLPNENLFSQYIYITDEDLFLQYIFNQHPYATENKIIEHLQKSLEEEYENTKLLLNLCNSILDKKIFPQIYYTMTSSSSEVDINEMTEILSDPWYISFIRVQLNDEIDKLTKLKKHIKKLQDDTLKDLDKTKRELETTNEERNKIQQKLNQKKQELIYTQNKANADLDAKEIAKNKEIAKE